MFSEMLKNSCLAHISIWKLPFFSYSVRDSSACISSETYSWKVTGLSNTSEASPPERTGQSIRGELALVCPQPTAPQETLLFEAWRSSFLLGSEHNFDLPQLLVHSSSENWMDSSIDIDEHSLLTICMLLG